MQRYYPTHAYRSLLRPERLFATGDEARASDTEESVTLIACATAIEIQAVLAGRESAARLRRAIEFLHTELPQVCETVGTP